MRCDMNALRFDSSLIGLFSIAIEMYMMWDVVMKFIVLYFEIY